MSKLLDLADRVEGLSGPDREVDAEIYVARGGALTVSKKTNHPPTDRYSGRLIPFYTSSIDAAMRLVPKGWHLGSLTDCDEDDWPRCCLTENAEPCRDMVGRGLDLPLSVCAAALRAIAGGDPA